MEEKLNNYLKLRNLDEDPEDFKKRFKSKLKNYEKSPDFKREYQIHRALSNKERFLIYKILSEEPVCTCVLSYMLNKTESTINRHLKILENANLIIGKKEGYFVLYYTRENFAKEFSFANI